MRSPVVANRRGLVNETAFQLLAVETNAKTTAVAQPNLKDVVRSVSMRLAKFDQSASNLSEELSAEEVDDIQEQLRRLRQLFPMEIGASFVIEPRFLGCGFLDACNGDVLRGSTLYEIKAGDRPLRSIDLRQLLTYTALNYIAKSHEIDSVAIANIRTGLVLELSVEELTMQVSGLHPSELFGLMAYTLASGDMSR